jgi:hypothetical protein
MTKMSQFVRPGRQFILWGTVALAIAGSNAMAQSAGTGSASTQDLGGYSKWDITPYVGGQWFQVFQGSSAQTFYHSYSPGWLFGERFTFDVSNHFSLEGSVQLGRNPMSLNPYGEANKISVVTYNTQVTGALLYNFQPRTAKNRFFFLIGPQWLVYSARALPNPTGAPPAGYLPPLSPLDRKAEPGYVYGFGLRHYFNSRFGFRLDGDLRINKEAHYGLPNTQNGIGSLLIPKGGVDSAAMVSVGFIIREGWVPPVSPVTAMSDTLRVDVPAGPSGAPTIAGVRNTVCPGDDLRLTANANGFPNPTYVWRVNGTPAAGATGAAFSAPTATGTGARAVTVEVSTGNSSGTSAAYSVSPGHTYHLTADAQGLGGRTASYQWMMNGQPISGATSSSLDLPDGSSGTVTVQVTVPNPPATSAPANFTIQPLTPPTLTFAVNPGTVPYTSGPIPLTSQATASPCGGAVTVRYSGEGVTGNTFTPGSVTGFDMGNRIRPQTKTVTITATATDAKNQTVTRTAPVTVTLDPEARRLDDIDFPNLSARVNNCGKRLLLEELTPMLRNDPGARVYLIGHRDAKEKGGKAVMALDETRALNAAAVLSAGKGICPSLDLSRIMYKAVAADQSDTTRPSLCGASTNVKEKAGQAIKESDKNAEFRRVEIWFIPSGAAVPAGVTGMMPLPADRMAKIGCPK